MRSNTCANFFLLCHAFCTWVVDAESFCSKLMSLVTSGWGPCHRCCEGICFPQIMFSHLVPSLEARDSSELDYISHVILHLITLSTLLPVLQPFLSPPSLSLSPAVSLPLRPSSLPVCIPPCLPHLPQTTMHNRPHCSAKGLRPSPTALHPCLSWVGGLISLPLGLGWLVTPQEAIYGLLDFSSLSPPQGFVLALGR